MKKDGGTIKNWQLHTLSRKYQEAYPETLGKILTGIVVEDPTGRWLPGYHMKSSLVVSFDGLYVETLNTIYRVVGEMGDTTLGGDWGDKVLGVFY
jgi:hypothetical protein